MTLKSSPQSRTRSLTLERLESRELLAADLAVESIVLPFSDRTADVKPTAAPLEAIESSSVVSSGSAQNSNIQPLVLRRDASTALWQTAPVKASELPSYVPHGSLPPSTEAVLLPPVVRTASPLSQSTQAPSPFMAPRTSPALSLVGDFDGDHIKEIGLFHDGAWWIDLDHDGVRSEGDIHVQLGKPGDRPLVSDWNGDGRDDLAVVAPNGAMKVVESAEFVDLDWLEHQRVLSGSPDAPRSIPTTRAVAAQLEDVSPGLRAAWNAMDPASMKYAMEIAERESQLR